MRGINVQNKFADATTTVTTTALLPYVVQRPALISPEDTLDPIGVFIIGSAIGLGSGRTYQVQLVTSNTAAGTGNQTVVADSGTMSNTDQRLVNVSNGLGFFLAVDWSLIEQDYLAVLITTDSGSASWAITGSWLLNTSDVPRFTTVAANYTP